MERAEHSLEPVVQAMEQAEHSMEPAELSLEQAEHSMERAVPAMVLKELFRATY